MFYERVELSFDAGHRLLGHNGNCAAPHGHTYRAEVLLDGPDLDRTGLLVDFGEIKHHLKSWIDQHWDHAFLVNDQDQTLITALQTVPESKVYLFPSMNPSAEAMARRLFQEAKERFGCTVRSVRIWESPTQYAEYREEAPA